MRGATQPPPLTALPPPPLGPQGTATATGDPALDLPKAEALSRALLLMTTIPWTLCALVYSAVHWTYPRDAARVRAVAAAAAAAPEAQPLGAGGAGEGEG